jgi:hypothetical protein
MHIRLNDPATRWTWGLALGAALLILAALTVSTPAQAASPQPDPVLCLPGVYLTPANGCTPAGPSAYLNTLAGRGMTLPLAPLPARRPDPTLSDVDVHYGLVRTSPAPIFATLEDALSGNRKRAARELMSAFGYISYVQDTVVDGKRFYEIDPGAWMTANDISRIGAIPRFQGLEFSRTPQSDFGWVLAYFTPAAPQTKRTPGYEIQDYTGREVKTHDVVAIYAQQQVGDDTWFLVGPDEWLPDSMLARVQVNPTPPTGITGERWIEVNLQEQTLAVYDARRLVFATIIASGAEPFWTQPGVFQIFQKLDTTPMRGSFEADQSDAYYLEDVPWTMYFDGARALHGAYWRAKLGYEQSHGCVNLSVGDAHWLYNWANNGDWVYVWDPSGKTPTDPALYSSGGY